MGKSANLNMNVTIPKVSKQSHAAMITMRIKNGICLDGKG
jgi:hypothetical protein